MTDAILPAGSAAPDVAAAYQHRVRDALRDFPVARQDQLLALLTDLKSSLARNLQS